MPRCNPLKFANLCLIRLSNAISPQQPHFKSERRKFVRSNIRKLSVAACKLQETPTALFGCCGAGSGEAPGKEQTIIKNYHRPFKSITGQPERFAEAGSS